MRGRIAGMDPNPYEPPQQAEPQSKPRKAFRLAAGALIAAFLTPIAVVVTFMASCQATDRLISADAGSGQPMSIPGAIFLASGPPLLVLIGMIALVIWLARRSGKPA